MASNVGTVSSGQSMDSEKVLVCLLASTRAHKLTFPSMKRHVLDELNADLALALLTDGTYDEFDPYWRQAKYRWTAPIRSDYGEAYDVVQRQLCEENNVMPPDWRILLGVKGIWLGGIKSRDPQLSASSILPLCRWILLRRLKEEGVIELYDRFVITRSDFVWLSPHPPLSMLEREALWVPEGENWDGLNDRHLVVSRAHLPECLNMIEDILLHPDELLREMKHRSNWNDEQFLAHHLGRKGLLQSVKTFPYVMYTARAKDDVGPTWSRGRYEPSVGHFVKYGYEFQMAKAYSSIIRTREDWASGGWTNFDPAAVRTEPSSLMGRVHYALLRSYYRCLMAWRRPDRIERIARFFKWRLKELKPPLR